MDSSLRATGLLDVVIAHDNAMKDPFLSDTQMGGGGGGGPQSLSLQNFIDDTDRGVSSSHLN